jgi:hypothetical protein
MKISKPKEMGIKSYFEKISYYINSAFKKVTHRHERD